MMTTYSVLETTEQTPPGALQALTDQLNAWAELPQPGAVTAPFTIGSIFARKATAPDVWWVVLDGILTAAITLRNRAEAAAAVGTAAAPGKIVTDNNLKLTEVEDLIASGYVDPPNPP